MSDPSSFRVRSLLLASFCLVGLALPAAAADLRLASASPVDVPACDAPAVLDRVRGDFAYGMARVEKSDLAIVEFGKIRSQGAGVNDPSHIPHRWCYAPVTLSNGLRSTAYWRVDRGVGFASYGYAGLTDDVESCVLGHDRWSVHDGACRTARRWW